MISFVDGGNINGFIDILSGRDRDSGGRFVGGFKECAGADESGTIGHRRLAGHSSKMPIRSVYVTLTPACSFQWRRVGVVTRSLKGT